MVRAQDERLSVDGYAPALAAPPAAVSIIPGGWRSILRSRRRAVVPEPKDGRIHLGKVYDSWFSTTLIRGNDNVRVKNVPTAPIAATGLIVGFAVAVLSGSRALGGLVLVICGGACIAIWLRRDGRQMTVILTIAGLLAFALSHLLGLIIGAWPAVLLTAAATAALYWRASDRRVEERAPL